MPSTIDRTARSVREKASPHRRHGDAIRTTRRMVLRSANGASGGDDPPGIRKYEIACLANPANPANRREHDVSRCPRSSRLATAGLVSRLRIGRIRCESVRILPPSPPQPPQTSERNRHTRPRGLPSSTTPRGARSTQPADSNSAIAARNASRVRSALGPRRSTSAEYR